ncbi:MAG: hypothetical protein DRP56_00605 [Planctomycetota bacterium]|nr:MAG: hypothetical protein DRP56_00605 [Planctomycetota bacterium]
MKKKTYMFAFPVAVSMVICFGALLLTGTPNCTDTKRLLAVEEMKSIVGKTGCWCGYPDSYCVVCNCWTYGGSGWMEIAGKKNTKKCALVPGDGCLDQDKQAWFTGSLYSSVKNNGYSFRRCGGIQECPETNLEGVNYTGPESDWCGYQGCN